MLRRKNKKQRKQHLKWWIIGGSIVAVIAITLLVLIYTTEDPPVENIEKTRVVLLEAKKQDAEIYCHKLYSQAVTLYGSVMKLWKSENEKFILFRDYKRVRQLADSARIVGEEAVIKAKKIQRDTREVLGHEISGLRQEMDRFEKIFSVLPLSSVIKAKHAKGKLLLNEAEIAFEKGNYNAGKEKSRGASLLIRSSYEDARIELDKYFTSLPRWQKQLEEAIKWSDRENSYAIVVEKIPPRCDLYYNGEKKHSFPVEFGRNWMGDKYCEGDYATPEGKYKVVKRLEKGMSKYHKALLIDYPNHEDMVEFRRRKKDGEIARNTRPGNLIEIHGGGGRGGNWTNGCVGLTNEDMDRLFKYVGKSTPVTIIGASLPLEKALEEYK